MTQLPTGKPVLPITPSCDEDMSPTTCQCCGRIALGIGRARYNGRKLEDPGYLCRQCIVAVSDLSKMDRLSHYELAALDSSVEAVGDYIMERGLGTDLSVYDELDQRMLCKAAWEGAIRGVRAALKAAEAPF